MLSDEVKKEDHDSGNLLVLDTDEDLILPWNMFKFYIFRYMYSWKKLIDVWKCPGVYF